MFRYTLMIVVLLMAVGLTPSLAVSGHKPNIILIVADDLGYGQLGTYGQKKIQTPNLDRLATEGMKFTQFYAGSHLCKPSRSALMTGQHSGHTLIRTNRGGTYLYAEDVTIAEVLKQADYGTGGFGKWALGIENTPGHPNRQGFDEFFGFLHQRHAHFYYPYYVWHNETRYILPGNKGKRRGQYAHDEIHAKALDFIRRHKDTHFFSYIPYTIPHVELVVPEESMQPYRGRWQEEPLLDPREGYIDTAEPYATLAGMVSRMDDHVGQIMTLLKQLGIDDNTIILFTSDNGAERKIWQRVTDFFASNGPLRGYKGQFYEGGIRVPLIVRWPGRITPGSVTDHVSAFWDILPTFADIAGVEAPTNIDGISFLPTLRGQERQQKHPFLYWEYHVRGNHVCQNCDMVQAMRMGKWKALQPKPGAPLELYNLESDLGETTNVANQHPEIIEKIKAYLGTAHTQARSYPVEASPPSIATYVR